MRNPNMRASRCVPQKRPAGHGRALYLELNLRAEIIANSNEIVFLYEELMDHRIVRLNPEHSVNLKPSWYGDSVGHWDGDTLVVDTWASTIGPGSTASVRRIPTKFASSSAITG